MNFDAIIIGSGATGGWAAKELSEKGHRVLVIDAGANPAATMTQAEVSLSAPERESAIKRQPIQSRHSMYHRHHPQLYVDDVDHPYTAEQPFRWIRGRQMGGRTLTWGGVTLRFSDYEFKAADRDGHGINWPLAYSDLKPYYDRVEAFLGVRGATANLAALPDGIFSPPTELSNEEKLFADKLRRANSPWVVTSQRGLDFGWARRSSIQTTLQAALQTGRTTLQENTVVSHLLSEKGRVQAVVCVNQKTGETYELRAKTVVLAASAMESVRILLNSPSQAPGGLGNAEGLLGRYIMDHPFVSCMGTDRRATGLPVLPEGGPHGIVLPRCENTQEENKNFLRGYGVWGWLQRQGIKPSGLVAFLEMLPRAENKVSLNEIKDVAGLRTLSFDVRYGENELAMAAAAQKTLRDLAELADFEIEKSVELSVPGGTVHEVGGARMGATPLESVTNKYNQCWEAKNLFVVDGACFPTAGWQNPTLTMMALACRAADFIDQQLRENN